jgi:sigma-E factor negative regulatory protein RseC
MALLPPLRPEYEQEYMSESVEIDYTAPPMVEGIAHVVSLEGNQAWLEPEQTSSCGGCSSATVCGAKGMGTIATRLEARRFQLPNDSNLRVGDRVVIGIAENTLVRASLTAYAIPLITLLISGGLAQWAAGNDLITVAAMTVGLALGLWLSRLSAGRLQDKGELSPRFIRRARLGETCSHE